LDKTDSGTDYIDIWLKKNGSNVDWTNTRLRSTGNDDSFVASWNFYVDATIDDYYEIAWYSADVDMRIVSHTAGTNPTRPGVPSIILTVGQI
jgi:hypothetical protein